MEEEVRRPDEEKFTGREKEVVDVNEERSDDNGETHDQRAVRRSSSAGRRLERKELVSLREEAAVLLAAKREAAETRRKGKQVVTPSKSNKSRSASLGVEIWEVATNPTQGTHHQEEEQHIEAFRRMEVDLNQKMLEAMVYFDDPKLKRNCVGRVSESRPAQSGRKVHYPSLQMMGVKEKFFGYIRGIGFGWLLEHAPCEVPVNFTKKFFTSFTLIILPIWTRSPSISDHSIR